MDEDHGPQSIASTPSQRSTMCSRLCVVKQAFTTKKGLIGDYDYSFLFRPNLPFMSCSTSRRPFFGLNDRMPVLLSLLLGLQHSLAMLAGIITPPLLLSGASGANLGIHQQQYLVSTALITSGILSVIQITRFRLFKSSYYIGTGVISVVGISFNLIPVALGGFQQMYDNGYCPSTPDGERLPCPQGYGALIGTSALCALIEMLISFIPARTLLRICPPIVTGPTVMLIGVHLIESGFKDWMGGSGPCSNPATATGPFAACPSASAAHPLPWGSAEFFGLGFSVFITVMLCERFAPPIIKSASVVFGLLVGCIIAAACGYFDRSGIYVAPAVSFIWVYTFPLSLYGPLVLPILAVYIVSACEAIGDITATCDVSKLEIDGPIFESRIQGGVLADGFNGLLSSLMTMTPMSTFAQNNSVIALTRCANRRVGWACCFFLIVLGIFAKFAAAIVSIPSSVIGGMTTFLFAAVAVSGVAIVARGVIFTSRNRFILTAGLALGYGATLVPTYFSHIFTYKGGNKSLQSFYDAIVLVMQTGFAITAAVCCILNLTLPEEPEDEVSAEETEPTGTVNNHQKKAAARDDGVPNQSV